MPSESSMGKHPQIRVSLRFWWYFDVMSTEDAADRNELSRPSVEPRFMTLEDVAIYLSVSVQQVYSLVRNGDLPAIKIGGRGVWRVDKSQLESYVERLHEETRRWAEEHPLNPRERA